MGGHRTKLQFVWPNVQMVGKCRQKSSEALLKIIWSTFTFDNMIASAGVVCESRVLLACFISGWGADSSFEADTAYKCTRNWYKIITKNCAINLLQNVWVWVYNVGTRAQETRWQRGSLRFSNYWTFINIITLLTSSYVYPNVIILYIYILIYLNLGHYR